MSDIKDDADIYEKRIWFWWLPFQRYKEIKKIVRSDNFSKKSMLWIVQNFNTFYKYCNSSIKCFFVCLVSISPKIYVYVPIFFEELFLTIHLLIKFPCNRKPFLPSFRKKTIYKKLFVNFPVAVMHFSKTYYFNSLN